MTKPHPPPDTKTPPPLYSCAMESCAEEASHRAEDLYWVAPLEGWYCDSCIDNLDELSEEEFEEIGPTLAEFLEGRK